MKIAIAHEHYPQRGGGEMVSDELARTFDAPVYAGFVNRDATAPDVELHDLFGDGVLGQLIRRSAFIRDAFYQFAWTDVVELRDFDVIVTSGNNPGWFVPRDTQTVVSYVHSPQRTPYDMWADSEETHGLAKHIYTKAARTLHPEGKYADRLVANSDLVKRRIVRYWDVDADDVDVVYPPIDVEGWSRHDDETSDYVVTWSRMFDNKNIDEIVRACNRTGTKLIVGGDGPERERLEEIAGPTVEFRGFVEWDELCRLVSGAKATLFAADNEDFGMVPVESMAAGTPVIGVREGFTRHQIIDGVNGVLFDRGVDNLVDAIERFESEGVTATEHDIERFAQQFSVERFRRQMRSIVNEAVEDSQIETSVEPPLPTRRLAADGGDEQ
ncbi:glycosyl transferase family 1 [Haloferax sp. Atlit-19N]|uniref:glycosyltransferase n=1 Tax=Haloferax sp. Atlit-19N TaxID=2077201 RepID=UPI000E27D87B|nr:glycosyltransferase [Haloferax sp. Atlit-19N]RDZ39353.1 glycosyl transferase family 1 [Haloferax sp. Atlit-19N]